MNEVIAEINFSYSLHFFRIIDNNQKPTILKVHVVCRNSIASTTYMNPLPNLTSIV